MLLYIWGNSKISPVSWKQRNNGDLGHCSFQKCLSFPVTSLLWININQPNISRVSLIVGVVWDSKEVFIYLVIHSSCSKCLLRATWQVLGIYWKEITHKGFSLARLADVSVMSAMKKRKAVKFIYSTYLSWPTSASCKALMLHTLGSGSAEASCERSWAASWNAGTFWSRRWMSCLCSVWARCHQGSTGRNFPPVFLLPATLRAALHMDCHFKGSSRSNYGSHLKLAGGEVIRRTCSGCEGKRRQREKSSQPRKVLNRPRWGSL